MAAVKAGAMRLGAVMMVRNEADIIEANLRHNLRILDHVLVFDHSSDDGTPGIVSALAAEGLPVTLVTDPTVGFHQGERSSEGARWLFQDQAMDWVFPLDADELLQVPSRQELEAGLALAAGLHVRVRLRTYVADDYADRRPFSPARFQRRLQEERYRQMRIAVSRRFAEAPTQVITAGNHMVLDTSRPGELPNYPGINASIVAVAHFPIRSAAQVINKTILGWLAHSVTHSAPQAAYHWRQLYEEIKAGRPPDESRMLELAVNYGLPREEWRPAASVALVHDPLPPIPEPRYGGQALLEPLPLLMAYAERLIRGMSPEGRRTS